METINQQHLLPTSSEAGRVMDFTLGLDNNSDPVFEAEVIDNDPEPTEHPNFIESNTQAISLEELENNCIVPTFADTTLTISHQNFIQTVKSAAEGIWGELTTPELRVSHPINGRAPWAQYKRKEDLTPEDTTLFYQRMAWICHVKSITRNINGRTVYLSIGGCRAYNEDRLYSRRAPMKFKIFVAWQVRVCSNLMLTCDGNSGTIECLTEADIYMKAYQLFSDFVQKQEQELQMLERLENTRLNEQQFVNIIGRLRLYEAMDNSQKKDLPTILFGDSAANAIARGFLSNPNFKKDSENDTISCYQLMQLSNEAIKNSYIDRWLDRNQNATDFAIGISEALNGNSNGYEWFLN